MFEQFSFGQLEVGLHEIVVSPTPELDVSEPLTNSSREAHSSLVENAEIGRSDKMTNKYNWFLDSDTNSHLAQELHIMQEFLGFYQVHAFQQSLMTQSTSHSTDKI